MSTDLFFHLLLHIITSLIAGYIVWKIWGKAMSAFLWGFIGGTLIDLDHLLDYFLAFGWSFNIEYFAKGYQFLKSDKIYILFHGWEYVIILLVIAIWAVKNKVIKSVILALALGLCFHLSVDTITNEGAKISTYSVIYRVKRSFELKELVTNDHYIDHQVRKDLINFE